MAYTLALKEARRLHNLGFAIHWLHEKSKRPIESGWTTGPRKTWAELKETYQPRFNVGVRLGAPSAIYDRGYLAVVDVDVKSEDPRHKKEALAAARKLVGNAECPVVKSGRGNGSRHYYCATKTPFKTFNPAASNEQVKVHMPSKSPSKFELATLNAEEIRAGIRIANAWEISLYSDGRQVVLPPSIHPDSGKPYFWKEFILSREALPILEFEVPATAPTRVRADRSSGSAQGGASSEEVPAFELSDFPVEWTDVSEKVKQAIRNGVGVTDRSAYLLPATVALHSAGLTRDEILSVLTDRASYVGACAFDHAQTTDRTRAAAWLWKYTVKRIMIERDAVAAFTGVPLGDGPKLSAEAAQGQTAEINAETDWRQHLERSERGQLKSTLNNCKTILAHSTSLLGVVGRNEFAANDFYKVDTPWRSRVGDAVTDIDIVRIKFYCAETFNVEFSDNIINQSLMEIADKNRFHPVRDWLSGLTWDGVARVDTWLRDYAGAVAPEPYLSLVSRKTLVAMVKRVFEPGCKFDHVLILEGLQGSGKSTLLRKLAGEWFSDATLNIGDKDAILTMQSKWLIELGELSSLGKAEVEHMKAFITQTTDRIRAPYGKRVEEFPRQCIFIGSTNQDEYLKDDTGNRRFWPVKASAITFDALDVVREQLFAEALVLYRKGEGLWFNDPIAERQAKLEQALRGYADEWMPIIMDIVKGETFPLKGFEMREVAKKMDSVGAHKLAPWDQQRIGKCLRALGFVKFQESTGSRRKLWQAGPNYDLGVGKG